MEINTVSHCVSSLAFKGMKGVRDGSKDYRHVQAPSPLAKLLERSKGDTQEVVLRSEDKPVKVSGEIRVSF
ncbi:MAG: hypothetical protein KDK78_02105 [Chlamydiia bacterium]|nr:hypothetical protein [Chlamydiia bacterium]